MRDVETGAPLHGIVRAPNGQRWELKDFQIHAAGLNERILRGDREQGRVDLRWALPVEPISIETPCEVRMTWSDEECVFHVPKNLIGIDMGRVLDEKSGLLDEWVPEWLAAPKEDESLPVTIRRMPRADVERREDGGDWLMGVLEFGGKRWVWAWFDDESAADACLDVEGTGKDPDGLDAALRALYADLLLGIHPSQIPGG